MAVTNPILGGLTEAEIVQRLADLESLDLTATQYADRAKVHVSLVEILRSLDELNMLSSSYHTRVTRLTNKMLKECYNVG